MFEGMDFERARQHFAAARPLLEELGDERLLTQRYGGMAWAAVRKRPMTTPATLTIAWLRTEHATFCNKPIKKSTIPPVQQSVWRLRRESLCFNTRWKPVEAKYGVLIAQERPRAGHAIPECYHARGDEAALNTKGPRRG